MPSATTHSYFILDVYEKLPLERKKFLKAQITNLRCFSQIPDSLQYYKTVNRNRTNKVRLFSKYFHTHKTGEYITTLINYIKYNYYKDNPEVMAFLYATISHYVLDCNINPFIYYYSGVYDKNKKKTFKYKDQKEIIENYIDQYMIRTRENKKVRVCKPYIDVEEIPTYSSELKEVIDFAFKETFKVKGFSNEIEQSVIRMQKSYKKYRYDKHGIKYRAYKVLDLLTPKRTNKYSFLSYYYKHKNIDYLNYSHSTWYYPSEKSIKKEDSYVDLYEYSIKETLEIIDAVNKYIYDDEKISLKRAIRNKSYITGLNLNKEQKMKYFNY